MEKDCWNEGYINPWIFWDRFGANMEGCYKRHSRSKEEYTKNKRRAGISSKIGKNMIKMALNEYKEMRKKGQVSFFMILGILLVIIVGFAIYLTSFSAKER